MTALPLAPPQPPPQAAPGWGAALTILGLLLAAVLLLYRDTASAMVTIWARSETFTHAFTVPPIVAWLIWRKRHPLAAQAPRANVWMLLPIAAAGLVWLLGDLAAVNAVTQFAFTALLVLVVVAVLGLRASRVIAFPLGFLFFSVPVGEVFMPQMMVWTADFTVWALRLSGIPVFREGLQFVIPSGNWSVVEACSGIRYLIASVMVGVLFAYLNYRSLRRRLMFVGVSILVPVLANWIRAYLIVLTGHLSNNRIAVGADHLIYGWVFFSLVILLMFMLGARWSEPAIPASTRSAAAPVAPLQRGLLQAVAAGAALLVIAPHLALWSVTRSEPASPPSLFAPAELADGWRLDEHQNVDWKPAFRAAAAEFNRAYSNRGQQVGLYVGYYRQQDHEHKLVSSDNTLVNTQDALWSTVSTGTHELRNGSASLTVRSAQLRGSAHAAQAASTRLIAWQLYWINGTFTSSDAWAKAVASVYRLLGRGDDAAAIVLYTSDRDGADAVLESFLRANLPLLDRQFVAVREARPQPTQTDAQRAPGALK